MTGILSLLQCTPMAEELKALLASEGMAHSGPKASQNVSEVPIFILKIHTDLRPSF